MNALKLNHSVKRMGMKLDSTETFIGSYAPSASARHEFRLPEDEWPSGMMARGSYSAKFVFADGDGNTHLTLKASLEIKKDWE